MKDLLIIDPSFNEGVFISKVNNIFIMLCMAIMNNDLDRVRHFIGKKLENKYDSIINDLSNNNLKQIYDDINISSTVIDNIDINDDKITINVFLVFNSTNYIVKNDTLEVVKGSKIDRIEKTYNLVFEKKREIYYTNGVMKCPNCGASIEVNSDGRCEFCKNILELEKYDYVLVDIR